MVVGTAIRPEHWGKAVKDMLSPELIGVIGLLYGSMVWAVVVTERERRGATISQRESEAQKVVKRV